MHIYLFCKHSSQSSICLYIRSSETEIPPDIVSVESKSWLYIGNSYEEDNSDIVIGRSLHY